MSQQLANVVAANTLRERLVRIGQVFCQINLNYNSEELNEYARWGERAARDALEDFTVAFKYPRNVKPGRPKLEVIK